MAAIDPIEFRFQQLEKRAESLSRRVDGIDDHGTRRMGIVEERVSYSNNRFDSLTKRLDKMEEEFNRKIDDLQTTIVRAAVTVAVSAVGSSLFIWLVVK